MSGETRLVTVAPKPAGSSVASASTVRVGTIVDRLTTGAGTVVLVEVPGGHRVTRLSELGAAVLELLDEASAPVSVAALAEGLVARFGPPDGVDPQSAVAQLLGVLADEYVVVAES
jgi:hypothetical protein